jgi:ribosomal-protein-alanine N-acetyltransferase
MNALQHLDLHFQPMEQASAHTITRWRYDPPYDLYNLDSGNVDETVQALLDPHNHYFQIAGGQGKLVAYCCFGPDAQVSGGDYGASALDIGLGIRPDLVGGGQGIHYVQAVLDFARPTFAPLVLRVTVAEFNRRALRVWEKAGFRAVQTFHRSLDGKAFVILTLEA